MSRRAPVVVGDRRGHWRALVASALAELLLAACGLLGGTLNFLLTPHVITTLALARAGDGVALAWVLACGAGQLAILAGTLTRRERIRLGGLWTMSFCLMVYAIALLTVRHDNVWWIASVLFGLGVHCALRAGRWGSA